MVDFKCFKKNLVKAMKLRKIFFVKLLWETFKYGLIKVMSVFIDVMTSSGSLIYSTHFHVFVESSIKNRICLVSSCFVSKP